MIRSDGSLIRDYLHVDDVTDAYLTLADRADEFAGEAFNFSDESPMSVVEIYVAICDVAGMADTEPSILGEASDEIPAQYLNASKARDLLGWAPTMSWRWARSNLRLVSDLPWDFRMSEATAEQLREEILDLVERYHAAAFPERPFVPGVSPVPVSGKVFDSADMRSLVDSSLDFWLTTGRFAEQFEQDFAERMGVRFAKLCNSGSSANLLAMTALTSPRLKDRRLVPGDEVITAAVGFPTTVNPIIQNGLVPVFVDVDLGTYDANVEAIEEAIGPRTKAIFMAHTLGNPFDLRRVMEIAGAPRPLGDRGHL